MMFAVALNESGYGQSEYALTNYNLFGHAAYDENPDSATTYKSLEDCIYQHAYGSFRMDMPILMTAVIMLLVWQ